MTASLIDTTAGASAPIRKSTDHAIQPEMDASLTSRGDRRFRPDIQGLRAVAVLLVVLYHAGVPGMAGGYVGVDVFFVISGFLITRQLTTESLATGRVSLPRFYARRIRRLLPSALLVILVTLIVARIWGPALEATAVARDGLFATFYSINYRLALEGVDYQHAAAAVSPLQHFWSLAVEEQFYLVWPVLILLVALLARGPLRRAQPVALFVIILAIGAASLSQSITVTSIDAPLAYFSLQTRGWELAAGALVAIAVPVLRRLPGALAATMSWLGAGMILFSAFTFSGSTPFPGALALVPVGGAVLIIASGLLPRAGSVEVVLRRRPMQFLGAVSYGWYLWHWPAIVLAPFLFHASFGWPENLEVSFLALWFAVLTYLTIERPSAKRLISPRRWFGIASVMTAITATITLVLSLVVPASLVGLGAPAASLDLRKAEHSLSKLLAAGANAQRLPANISPSLASAAEDVPVTSSDGCHLGFTETRNASCVFGDVTATRTLLVFGDSHAEQWFGAINAMAKADHWKLVYWTKSACPIADVVLENEQLNRDYTECGTWRTATLRRIAALHPDAIIASQADTLAGPGYSDSQWAAETGVTVKELKSMTTSLIFIADTPHPTEDVPQCVAAHLASVSQCNVPVYSKTPYDYLSARRAAVAATLKSLAVPVIDPTGWFCTAKTCPVVVANTMVYRDDSHMTQHYSLALEPVLNAVLAKLLPQATKSN